jgi:hypothetical protein
MKPPIEEGTGALQWAAGHPAPCGTRRVRFFLSLLLLLPAGSLGNHFRVLTCEHVIRN